MIAYLSGKIAHKEPTHVVIDCHGIGYFVKISLQTYTQIQHEESVKLHTYFQVREDAHVLYGFFELKEKALFEHLLSVSGVGGNSALTILSGMSPVEIANAIHQQNFTLLKKIKGIGQKTAERIVLELKDKVVPESIDAAKNSAISGLDMEKYSQAIQALTTLGFVRTQIEPRVTQILKETNNEITIQDLIKRAMRG
jgi:Holliday junction DNA helicase RuvA